MAIRARSKPFGEVTDGTLRKRAADAEARVREVKVKVKAGTATRDDLEAGTKAVAVTRETRGELQRRAQAQRDRNFAVRWGRRSSPLELVVERDPSLLWGVTLVVSRLSDADLDELRSLLKKLRAEGELSSRERTRYEKIVGKAAGEIGLYERKRREVAQAKEADELADTIRVASLRPRRKLAEPGSVGLPRLVHRWLAQSRGQWDVLDVGVLATVLLVLENESAEGVVLNAHVERDPDGEPVLVIGGELQDLRLHPGCAPDGGTLSTQAAIRTLSHNKWLTLAREGRKLRIRRGELALRCREGSP